MLISDVVKHDGVKKVVYNAKIKYIEDKILYITINVSLNAKINEIKGEIPNFTKLTTNATLNAKINEVKGEIPNIINLPTTTTALSAVKNKIPNVSNLVKKIDYNTKINKYTTQEFNKLTSKHFTARLKQANVGNKNDTFNFVKNTNFDEKNRI